MLDVYLMHACVENEYCIELLVVNYIYSVVAVQRSFKQDAECIRATTQIVVVLVVL